MQSVLFWSSRHSGVLRVVEASLFFLLSLAFPNEGISQGRAEEVLRANRRFVVQAAETFSISPRLLASVIYAEQSLNVSPGEIILDHVLAKSGYNSSMGIAQIKVNTARWIELQLVDEQGEFFLGNDLRKSIGVSDNDAEIIDKLENPKTNFLYAAAYLAMIEKLWRDSLSLETLKSTSQGIKATLYSLGLLRPDGAVRQPHSDAQLNRFGSTAKAFFDSILLRKEFPS